MTEPLVVILTADFVYGAERKRVDVAALASATARVVEGARDELEASND